MQILVPSLVPLPLVPRAVAGSATANQTATIAGPALGGFLYAVESARRSTASAARCSCWPACWSRLIRIERAAPPREPFTLATFFAGFGFIRRNPIILGAISLDLFAVLLGGATALLPVFARDVFAAGPWALGLLRAAPAVGALAHGDRADALVVRAQRRTHHVRGGRGLRARDHRVRAVELVRRRARWRSSVLGASDMVSVVIRMTLVQLGTPDEMRGRVTAVNALFIGASNQLGEFRAGAMAALARRGAGRADRRHRHAGDRGDLDAAVSRSSRGSTG